MKVSFAVLGLVLSATTFAMAAHAEDAKPSGVACVDGRFGDHVEKGRAEGDAKSIVAAKKVFYAVDVSNAGEPTQVTLVWSIDGNEVQRQSLDVGRSPHWHTWGWRPSGTAKSIAVRVLDADGNELRTDAITLASE